MIIRFKERKVGPLLYIVVPLMAVLLAFLTGSGMMVWARVNPIIGYSAFFSGSLGSISGITDTLLRMTPFLFMGVGIAFSNRAGILNIGAEGQYIMGAIAATWVTLLAENLLPAGISILASLAIGAIVGGVWALFAGVLKAYLGINEIVTTVTMNWIAFRILQWLLRGPLKNPTAQAWPMSPPLKATLPIIFPGTRLHAGFLIALFMAIIAYYVLFKTDTGFKLRVIGQSTEVGRYSGYSVAKYMLISMMFSGAMAGLAGSVEILGVFKFLYEGIAVGLGYTAIIVSLVGKDHPLAIIPSAFLFGIIYNGASYLQAATGLPYTFSKAVEGLIYLFILISEVLILYKIEIVQIGSGQK